MKKISQHLGELIVALAGVLLLITAITLFHAPIGGFFNNVVDNELEVGNKVLDQIYIPPKYTIIKGAGQTYSTGTLSFTSDAPFSKFAGVKVNDELVDPVNYTVEEGSTIITFTEEYSKVLAKGDYTIEVLATDGVASAPFDVEVLELAAIGNVRTATDASSFSLNKRGTYTHTRNGENIAWNMENLNANNFHGKYVWTDGEKVYFSRDTDQCVLNLETKTWDVMTWNGLTAFSGENVWSDGTNIYYSGNEGQYVLNCDTDTWESKTWTADTGSISVKRANIWTDGTNIYSTGTATSNYVLNTETGVWVKQAWKYEGEDSYCNLSGKYIWSDGETIYCSYNTYHYVLEGDTWKDKTWNGVEKFVGYNTWTDGTDTFMFMSPYSPTYVLNGDTWENAGFDGIGSYDGSNVWTDGETIYVSKYTVLK